MRRFEFRLPPPPARGNPAWVVVSVAVHALVFGLVVVLVARARFLTPDAPTTTFIRLDETLPTATVYELPVLEEDRPEPLREEESPPQSRPRVATGDTVSILEAVVAPIEAPLELVALETPTPRIAGRRVIGPAYAGGHVWVEPFEAELGVVEASPDRATHAERVAAAVTALVRSFADTMPADSFATPGPVKWTTTNDSGQTWGIDQTWLYLGDIKIPTLLLALLNLPQGNYYQAQDEANLRRIRADIMQAATRIETAESIRDYVKEIRRRKDAEREAERARVAAERELRKGSVRDTVRR